MYILDTIYLSGIVTNGATPATVTWYESVNDSPFSVIGDSLVIETVAPSDTGTTVFILKVENSEGDSAKDTLYVTVINDTSFAAFAGADTSVGLLDTIKLHGSSTGIFAVIASWWQIDTADSFITALPDTEFVAPSTPGILICVFKVENIKGQVVSDTVKVKIVSAPSAEAGNDTTVGINDSIHLHGTGTDTDGSIVKYEWKFGSDTGWVETSTGDTTITAPSTARAYVCSLRVTDDDGLTGVDDITITVTSSAPTADAGNDTTVGINDPINLHGTGTDTDGSIVKYEWKFGSSEWVETSTGDTTRTVPSTAQAYVCSLRVTDDDRLTGVDWVKITVELRVTDINGNVYHTVTIGNQVWTVENLRTTTYNDSEDIGTSAYCYYNNTTDTDSIEKYGALYNWYAVNTGKLAPAGWHVPDSADWQILQNYLIANGYNWDSTTAENKIAKSMATKTGWDTSTTQGHVGNDPSSNNSSGFSGLPGGYRYDNGNFNSIGNYGGWWSDTEGVVGYAYYRNLNYNSYNLGRETIKKEYGFSVRLVRD